MNPFTLLSWVKRNISLSLLIIAMASLVVALGEVIRGVTWAMLMPVAMSSALCGWLGGASRSNSRRVIRWLVVLGMVGIFIYITGLGVPIGTLILSAFFVASHVIIQPDYRISIDFAPLISSWSDLIQHISALLSRLGDWGATLVAGKTATDPVVTGLAWNTLLWLVGFWSGWYLSRNRQALGALVPSGLVLALVLDYTGNEAGLLILYLAILLILLGVSRYDGLVASWRRRGVDFSDSIALDSMFAIIPLTALLVGLAAVTPSLSWQELAERIREANRDSDDRVVESLGLDNPQETVVYGSTSLERYHVLGIPPELSQELIFTIDTGESPVLNPHIPISVQRYYWRTTTYDIYTGRGWTSRQTRNASLPANTPLMEPPPGYRVVHQQVHVALDRNERVYWTGMFVQADVDLGVAWRSHPPSAPSPAHAGDMLGILTNTSDYNVISILPQVSAAQLRAAGSDYPPEVTSRYLDLPDSVPDRVFMLARQLTKASPTPYDRALAIETYLRRFPYTLDVVPPPPGPDVVDYFLFTLQKGYCDYYASAMVVLARAAGLPARIVFGYASGTYNQVNAQYEVRQKDAHSWPEIYFPEIGWVEFEPTASLPIIFRLGRIDSSQPAPETAPEGMLTDWLKRQWRSLAFTIAGQILLAVGGLALIFALWQAGEIWLLHLMPARRAICSLYTRLEKNSVRLLPALPRGHTPHELQVALAHRMEKIKGHWLHLRLTTISGEVEQIVSLFEEQIFSQKAPKRPQVRAGIKAWARLRWTLWIAERFQLRGGV